ncbi:MAG TPA: ABC transporter permease [Caldisericia bacterium]|nr:ABC transporter permease [Caldisericia bacterium]HPF48261.1 ABC transporter permease [Caldisericia bacterium]HPI83803.1 ABC transporter permease [Caldisericia bacterium]HPQ92714.1 ABC transporter permease [Caldisericia bacterium]HRV74188.1 ABC transporter permease [Caldisericia bacterium]
MLQYILKRLLHLLPVLFGITFLTFMLFLVVPGDPVRKILGQHPDPVLQEQIKHELGLDLPWPIRYGRFVWNAAQGDLGTSVETKQPVSEIVASKFPATLRLATASMIFAVLLGIPTGIISATKQYSITDNIFMFFALVGVSMPIFVLGLILILFFVNNLHWIQGVGYGDGSLEYLILPMIALGVIPLAMISRMTRSTLLEQINSDHVRTARAKGVKELVVIYKHALRNALIPIVTVIGNYFASLMAGAIITERVFSWPGLGTAMISAIESRDFPIVMGVVLVMALIFVLTNLAVDVSYALIDPRVRLK